eukprot:4375490-Amphidinium_carterae.1
MTVCLAMLGMVRNDDPNQYVAAVREIADSGGQGARFILRNSLLQNDHWKKLQALFLSSLSASASIDPQMQSTIRNLRSDAPVDLMETVKNIIRWRDMLRPGATSALETALLDRCAAVADTADSNAELTSETKVATLSSVQTVIAVWVAAPLSQSLANAGLDMTTAKSLQERLTARAATLATAASEAKFLAALNTDISQANATSFASIVTVLDSRGKESLSQDQVAKLEAMRTQFLAAMVADIKKRSDPSKEPMALFDNVFECYKAIVVFLGEGLCGVDLIAHYHSMCNEYRTAKGNYKDASAWVQGDTSGKLSASLQSKLEKAKGLAREVNPSSTDTSDVEIATHTQALEASVAQALGKWLKTIAAFAKDEQERVLHDAITSVKEVVGGTRSGSWKAEMAEDATWMSVVSAAQPLLAGEVATELGNRFKKLLQDGCTKCPQV